MQGIHFYSLSIFLSCVKLSLCMLGGGGTSTLTASRAVLGSLGISSPTKSSTLFPSSTDCNSSSISPLGIKSKIQPLSSNNSSTKAISAVNRNNSDHFTSKNNMQDLAGLFDNDNGITDSPGEYGTDSFKLYGTTGYIFEAVFNFWIGNNSQLEEIANCIGIPEDYVLTVNGSMAQLFAIQHDKTISIQLDNLAKLFYYMTDIKHMIKRDEEKKTIIDNVNKLIEKIEKRSVQNASGVNSNNDLQTVVENLKNFLKSYKNGNYNNIDIMVNASLMKGLMLINLTKDDELNFELNKLRRSLEGDILKKIKEREFEIDGPKIANNHVEVIRNSLPCVFSLLHNHITLLEILSKDTTLLDSEKESIQIASKLFKNIVTALINRFKYFGKLNDGEISDLNKITHLLDNLDTGEMDQKNTQKLIAVDQENTQVPSGTELESTKEPSTSKLDIKELLDLTEPAIEAVLNLVGENDIEKWKKNSVFQFKDFQINQNKEYFMNLLTNNADTAYLLAGVFQKSFMDEIDYMKFHNGGNEVFFL